MTAIATATGGCVHDTRTRERYFCTSTDDKKVQCTYQECSSLLFQLQNACIMFVAIILHPKCLSIPYYGISNEEYTAILVGISLYCFFAADAKQIWSVRCVGLS